MTTEGKLVVDVTMSLKVGSTGGTVATLEQVKDALSDDCTDLFRNFAKRENLALTTQDEIAEAAGKFAAAHVSLLP